jgi:hypothetical protein
VERERAAAREAGGERMQYKGKITGLMREKEDMEEELGRIRRGMELKTSAEVEMLNERNKEL